MAIIKQNRIVPPTVATFAHIQNLDERPTRTYRELLTAEDAAGNPVPYAYQSGGAPVVLRIPHGLSDAAAPGTGTAAVGAARIPDVVIPIVVADVDGGFAGDGLVMPFWGPVAAAGYANGPSTGFWADENYIYVVLLSPNAERVSFVVYVEYTHSVITNEVVTGDYEVVA